MYGRESWTKKKVELQEIYAFELWCWRRLLRVPWTARPNRSILKEISPEYSLEGLMLKLKLLLWPPDVKKWLSGKDPSGGKDWRQEEKGSTEDEIVGWNHRLDGHEFEQAPGLGEGQGSLVCCSPWGCKESDMTERLNNDWESTVWGTEGDAETMPIYRFYDSKLPVKLPKKVSWEVKHGLIFCPSGSCILL